MCDPGNSGAGNGVEAMGGAHQVVHLSYLLSSLAVLLWLSKQHLALCCVIVGHGSKVGPGL